MPLITSSDSRIIKRRATAASWWLITGLTPIAAYAPIGAASLAASYVNLANPGTDITVGVAPTWDAINGWQSSGTAWLNTGINPAAGDTVLVRYSNVTSTGLLTGAEIGGGSQRWYFGPYGASGILFGIGGSAFRTPNLTAGVVGFAGQQPYRNGVADGAAIASGTIPAYSAYILASRYDTGGTAAYKIAAYIQAYIWFRATLSAAQMLAQTTAMAAL